MTYSNPSSTPTPAEAAAIVRGHQSHHAEAAPTTHPAEPGEHGHDEHGGGIHMPSPSVWPIVSAFGITMISFGMLTGWAFGVFGGAVLAISLWKWAGEMRRDAA
ncbi:MAG: hypothetical protein QM589_17825 [Thermomicrobiales bacterium]